MAKTKRKRALPRVTILAYSSRELLLFAEAVEQLRHVAADLKILAAELKAARPKRKSKADTNGEGEANVAGG